MPVGDNHRRLRECALTDGADARHRGEQQLDEIQGQHVRAPYSGCISICTLVRVRRQIALNVLQRLRDSRPSSRAEALRDVLMLDLQLARRLLSFQSLVHPTAAHCAAVHPRPGAF